MNIGQPVRKRRRSRTKGVPEPHRVDPSADWTRRYEYQVHGRYLAVGTEVSIKGESGRFRFQYAIEKPDGTVWLEFIGGRKGCEVFRSFYPERVRRVHRLKRTRANHERTEE